MVANPSTTSEKAERFQYKKAHAGGFCHGTIISNLCSFMSVHSSAARYRADGPHMAEVTEAGFERYPTWTFASAIVLDMRGIFAPHDILSQL